MALQKTCCFKGRGEIALAEYAPFEAGLAGLIPVGNAGDLAVNISEQVDTVPDFTQPGGGIACTDRQIEKVEISFVLHCHSDENIARSLMASGSSGNVATASVVSEPHVAWPGAIVPLDGIMDNTVAPVVKDPTGTTTYVLGTDYEITLAGSLRIKTDTNIPAPTLDDDVSLPNIKVTYTQREHTLLQLFTRTDVQYRFHFDGVNISEGNRPQQFALYKVSLSPAKQLKLISADRSVLEITGTAEFDATKPTGSAANPLSSYGTLRRA
jgi:hypothetical protein